MTTEFIHKILLTCSESFILQFCIMISFTICVRPSQTLEIVDFVLGVWWLRWLWSSIRIKMVLHLLLLKINPQCLPFSHIIIIWVGWEALLLYLSFPMKSCLWINVSWIFILITFQIWYDYTRKNIVCPSLWSVLEELCLL